MTRRKKTEDAIAKKVADRESSVKKPTTANAKSKVAPAKAAVKKAQKSVPSRVRWKAASRVSKKSDSGTSGTGPRWK